MRRAHHMGASALVVVLALVGTACTSSSGANSTQNSKPSPRPPAVDASKWGVVNTLNPKAIAGSWVGTALINLKDQTRWKAPVECTNAAKMVGQRRCDFGRHAVVITTYLEGPKHSSLYKAVLDQQTFGFNRHAFTGDLSKQAEGVWYTFQGTFRGAVFHVEDTGATVVITFDSQVTRDMMGKVVYEAADTTNTDGKHSYTDKNYGFARDW